MKDAQPFSAEECGGGNIAAPREELSTGSLASVCGSRRSRNETASEMSAGRRRKPCNHLLFAVSLSLPSRLPLCLVARLPVSALHKDEATSFRAESVYQQCVNDRM